METQYYKSARFVNVIFGTEISLAQIVRFLMLHILEYQLPKALLVHGRHHYSFECFLRLCQITFVSVWVQRLFLVRYGQLSKLALKYLDDFVFLELQIILHFQHHLLYFLCFLMEDADFCLDIKDVERFQEAAMDHILRLVFLSAA